MIYGNNNHYKIKILTDKGYKYIHNLYPGDKVHDYKSSNYFTVNKIIPIKYKKICRIEYDDGRSQLIGLNDMIYIGNNQITQLNETLNNIKTDIETHSFEYKELYNILNPDPYIAGALLIYGNYDTKYISLPMYATKVCEELAYKYKIQYADIIENNQYFFSYHNTENRITWEEFFPDYKFYAKTLNKDDPIIPYEYQFASVNDRRQFVRGVFDAGYDKEYSKYYNMIIHNDENKLKEFQKILWSLGILSKIEYIPKYRYNEDNIYASDVTFKRYYQLELINSFLKDYPGFYFDYDNIINMIQNHENMIIPIQRYSEYRIKSVKIIGSGVIDNIILDIPNATYITENYLPRISL